MSSFDPAEHQMASPAPTPYPDVNAVLAMLLDGAQSVLGVRFVRLYLYGSLAAPCPTINEGRFYLDKQGSDWTIQLDANPVDCSYRLRLTMRRN